MVITNCKGNHVSNVTLIDDVCNLRDRNNLRISPLMLITRSKIDNNHVAMRTYLNHILTFVYLAVRI